MQLAVHDVKFENLLISMIWWPIHFQLYEVPFTYREAVRSSKNEEWKIPMDNEMQFLQKNPTWEFTQLPKNNKVIRCK